MDTTQPPLAVVRDAASLIVLRQDGGAPSMLMGLRGAGHRFMPNRLVFPGGGVDPDDASAPFASPLQPHVQAFLERAAAPSLARAIAIAAARELEEETGLTLGTPPALAGLDYLGRLVTPAISPIRFNARFLVVDAAAVSGTMAGSGELEDLGWLTIDAALALDLAGATRSVIGLLRRWMAMAPDERGARRSVPVMENRVFAEE